MGRTLHGQLTVPLGVDPASAPLVVEPHGGPQCSDDSSIDGFAQYFATNGYAFFRPDPRGSDGYGDWSYKAIVGNWGEGPAADDLAGVDAAWRAASVTKTNSTSKAVRTAAILRRGLRRTITASKPRSPKFR